MGSSTGRMWVRLLTICVAFQWVFPMISRVAVPSFRNIMWVGWVGGGPDSTPDTIAPRNAFRRAPGVSQGSSNDGDLAILVATVGAADLFRIFLRRARFPSIVREPPPPHGDFSRCVCPRSGTFHNVASREYSVLRLSPSRLSPS